MKLSKKITLQEFKTEYWYTKDLKIFAKEIGIPLTSKLRKDELEDLIKTFIVSGKIKLSNRKNLNSKGEKDFIVGLHLAMEIKNYTSNKITKSFIVSEALKLKPGLKRKSGARYRLNRWRENQLNKGIKVTYRDLVLEYIRLNETTAPFEKIPQVRYINFLADFLKSEKNATRSLAINAWKEVKKMKTEKTYQMWKANHNH